ncbi:MAG TPA: alpha/beta fold hydrolase, partial [Polyangiales bacterium]|nr:alpha/beta fold hydrolase [Polyangiales bacterium]
MAAATLARAMQWSGPSHMMQAPNTALAVRTSDPRAEQRLSSLVSIQSGSGTPFFCVHGSGGNVLNFRDLASRLGSSQSFYGLQAPGVDGSAAVASVEELAEQYIGELLQVRPQGPYLLGGYSSGGIIAFEMARRLHAAGFQTLLVLLDTFAPGVAPRGPSLGEHVNRLMAQGPRYLAHRAREKLNRQSDSLHLALKIRFYQHQGAPLPYELREHQLNQAALAAAARYKPAPHHGPSILYRAAHTDDCFRHIGPQRGWNQLLPNLRIFEVAGNHTNFIQ